MFLRATIHQTVGLNGEINRADEAHQSRDQPENATDEEAPALADVTAALDVQAKLGVAGLGLHDQPAVFEERPTLPEGTHGKKEKTRSEGSVEHDQQHIENRFNLKIEDRGIVARLQERPSVTPATELILSGGEKQRVKQA